MKNIIIKLTPGQLKQLAGFERDVMRAFKKFYTDYLIKG